MISQPKNKYEAFIEEYEYWEIPGFLVVYITAEKAGKSLFKSYSFGTYERQGMVVGYHFYIPNEEVDNNLKQNKPFNKVDL